MKIEWLVAIVVACAVVVILIILTLIPALMINGAAFLRRQDKNPLFKYMTEEEAGIKKRPIIVNYRGQELSSYVYSEKSEQDCERVVIFVHGFGAGTASYTTEIARLSKMGYAVVATDAYGCNNSVGKNIKGFYAGAEAVIATFISIKQDEALKDKKVVLVGHSWGAYSALAASLKVKADGIVAMSSFNAPAQCVCDTLKGLGGIIKAYSHFVHFWFWVINLFTFGAKGNLRAAKAAAKNNTPTLLIQGEKDAVVPVKHSAAAKAKGGKITKLMLEDKGHNPYASAAAEEKLKLLGNSNFVNEEQAREYFANFDWQTAVEEDDFVMLKIDEFIKSC